jgi:ABC-type dipeptide/oligopeptide/nickel transport system permease component
MLAHYLRRILGGLLTLFLASFLFYNMFMYMPVPPQILDPPPPPTLLRYYIQRYEMQHPWPLNYANWLFDPTEPDQSYRIRVGRTTFEYVPPHLDFQVGPVHLHGSGLLTGDLGHSELVNLGVPVIDIMGRSSVPLSLALLICANALLMAASVVQRKGRKPVLGAASVPLASVARIEATYRYARAAT